MSIISSIKFKLGSKKSCVENEVDAMGPGKAEKK
jgi:hypothetical protein